MTVTPVPLSAPRNPSNRPLWKAEQEFFKDIQILSGLSTSGQDGIIHEIIHGRYRNKLPLQMKGTVMKRKNRDGKKVRKIKAAAF